MKCKFSYSGYFTFLCLALLLIQTSVSQAATPPGTLIRSQAEAFYLDENNESYFVSSNEVVTLIQEVTGALLESEQRLWGMKDTYMVFSHKLTNNGNISADYLLESYAQPCKGDKPSELGKACDPDRSKRPPETTLYIDKDHDGVPKSGNKVNGAIPLEPGENISLLIKTRVPDIDYTDVVISARVDRPECRGVTDENTQGRCLAVNRNQMSRSKGVVYEVSQSADREITYVGDEVKTTLTFIRKESRSYKSYVAIDYQLPEELEYVEGSSQLCRYDGRTCRQHRDPEHIPTGLRYYLEETNDQVGSPESRHEGQVRFKARVKSGVSKTLYNGAEYTFRPIGEDISGGVRQKTNYVPLTIKGFGVSLNGSPYSSEPDVGEPVVVQSAKAGGMVTFTNYLWNRGTEPATYRLSLDGSNNNFPAGSLYCLTDGDCTPASDNPQLDIGDIEPGSYREIRVKVQLPQNADTKIAESIKNAYRFTVKAEAIRCSKAGILGDPEVKADEDSSCPYEVTDDIENILMSIIAPSSYSVDLTFDQSLNDKAEAPGRGKGPEATPLQTLSGVPGTTLVFDKIFVNNTGSHADNYQIELLPGPDGPLPESFSWTFLNEYNRPVSNTGTVAKAKNAKLKLLVDLPAGASPGTWSFYIRVYSPVNGVEDKLHLALTVDTEQRLTLEPDRQAQVMPGSFVTFAHTLTNKGNHPIDNIQLSVSDSPQGKGWQSLIYNDQQGDGQLAGDDTIIDGPFSLPAGQTLHLIIKTFAPANAAQGDVNITTLTATWEGGDRLSVADTATVNSTDVVITKEQAPWNCSGPLPTRFSRDSFPAKPGSCVVYRLTATNQGVETVQNVVIHDAAPNFTVFFNQGGLPKAEQAAGEPSVSGRSISATWTKLNPGASVILLFGIQIQ